MNGSRRTPRIVRAWRLARLAWHLLGGVGIAALLLPRLSAERREQRIQQWCAEVLHILHVRVTVLGEPPPAGTRTTLFVANHISWIDIWALKATYPMRFVAKAEIRSWPLVGWLAERTGTLFITRERRHDTGRVVRAVEQALRDGACLCLFPEGTTSDGTRLMPFKASLTQAAIAAQAQLWPLAIRYPDADGQPNTAIAYHGDMTMKQSLREVLKQPQIEIELEFAAPLQAGGLERRALAAQARSAIAALLNLPAH